MEVTVAVGVPWSVEVSGLVTCSTDLPAAWTPMNTSTRPPISVMLAPIR
jgi:hypothetical protein